MTEPQDLAVSESKRKWEARKQAAYFVLFSAGSIWAWASDGWGFEKRRDWLFAGGSIFFPILATVSLLSILRSWSPDQEDRILTKTLWWVIGGPIALGLGAWALITIFGWFGSIPSWAAVIIVLLIAILVQRQR